MSTGSGVVSPWVNPSTAFPSYGYSLPTLQSTRRLIVNRPIFYHPKALRSVPNANTVVATDDNYGNKEVISVNPRLYDYLLANVREPKVLCYGGNEFLIVFIVDVLLIWCCLNFRYCVSLERKLLKCVAARCR